MEASTMPAVETSERTTEAVKSAPPLSPLDQAFAALLQPLKKSLGRIETHLAKQSVAAQATPTEAAGLRSDESFKELCDRIDRLSAEWAEFRRETTAAAPAAAASVSRMESPAEEVVAAVVPDDLVAESLGIETHDSWEEILLGSELSNNQPLSGLRQKFLADVIAGLAEARALAGQLLLCQTSSVEEMPERFRHVGEAYYRWRPRTTTADDPFEQALATWLTRRADEAGLRNSIQLVRPGDRFDGNRHSAATRGVEVVAVHGWVVLRDNQKVYTKASVTVQ
jgi:hypothetical protein